MVPGDLLFVVPVIRFMVASDLLFVVPVIRFMVPGDLLFVVPVIRFMIPGGLLSVAPTIPGFVIPRIPPMAVGCCPYATGPTPVRFIARGPADRLLARFTGRRPRVVLLGRGGGNP